MKVALGCDHRGFSAKQDLLSLLKTPDFLVEDFGCHSILRVDYPDIAYPLALAVASHDCDLGILIDGNGMGMIIVANKVQGVRAVAVHDEFAARCAREQYHCNIIGIGADLIGGNDLRKVVQVFLLATTAPGHHARRIDKLKQIEERLARARVVNLDPAVRYSFEDSR